MKPFSARELLARVSVNLQLSRTRQETARVLKDEAQTLELLNRVGNPAIAAELDLERTVQVVTDAATEPSGAAFGSSSSTMSSMSTRESGRAVRGIRRAQRSVR